jgi:RND family efflux transporter MFP subunit
MQTKITMKNTLVLLSIAILFASCAGKKEEKAALVEKPAKTVKVLTLKKQTITVEEEFTATLSAYDKVFLAPTIPGRVKNVYVDINDRVIQGQKVVDMDDTQLKQLQVQFNTLAKEMQRMDTLKAYGSVSDQSYDQVKAQYDATKMNLDNLKENTVVNSTLSGIVTGRYFENDEIYSGAPNTQQGKAAIVTIEQLNKLKAMFNVQARYFPAVKEGMSALLTSDIFPDTTFNGKVSLVYPTIDPTTRTFTVEVTLPNLQLTLRPGMYSKIKLQMGKKQAVMVPSAAVLMLEGTSERYVMVAQNNTAEMIKVSVGTRFDDQLEIYSNKELRCS